MNPEIQKEKIQKNIGKEVIITVYKMRNKQSTYTGKIKGVYPHIFTIYDGKKEKSFCYRDLITKDIKIKYK